MINKKLVMLFATPFFFGCGLKTYSSGVMKLGPDTYNVSADDLNPSIARRVALDQAASKCKEDKLELLVTNINASSSNSRNLVSVTFQCLTKGDATLQRPRYERSPDLVIENR